MFFISMNLIELEILKELETKYNMDCVDNLTISYFDIEEDFIEIGYKYTFNNALECGIFYKKVER